MIGVVISATNDTMSVLKEAAFLYTFSIMFPVGMCMLVTYVIAILLIARLVWVNFLTEPVASEREERQPSDEVLTQVVVSDTVTKARKNHKRVFRKSRSMGDIDIPSSEPD